MLDTKVFKIENGRAMVNHKILNEIAYEKDWNNKMSKTFPVEAYELYDEVESIVSSNKLIKLKHEDLIVPEKAIKLLGRGNQNEVHDLGMHRLTQHIGCMRLVTKEDKDMSIGVAIACNERGIRIAFGTRVWVCSNQCIFGDKQLSTFGPNGMPYDKMMEVLREYMNRFESIRDAETKIIYQMQQIELNLTEIQRLVGDLYIQSRSNLNSGKQVDNLTVTDIGKIMDQLIVLSNEREMDILHPENVFSLWDFYNTSTIVLNPLRHNDPVNTLEPNSRLMQYMMSKYGLDVPMLN